MEEVAQIFYVDTLTNEQNIINALLTDSLTVSYTNGNKGKVKNMFDFTDIIEKQDQQKE